MNNSHSNIKTTRAGKAKTLLHIDASAREDRSLTRDMGRRFMAAWRADNPNDVILHRDVGLHPPPYVSQDWVAAAFTPQEKRTPDEIELLATSDTLIGELACADILVIATPMYNYGMPAALKAWVDQVIRVDKTFTFDLARGDHPLEAVLSGKAMVLLTSSGEYGFAPGGERAGMNHLDPHLRTLGRYFGVAEDYHIAIEYQEFGDARHTASVTAAHAAIPGLVANLSRKPGLAAA